MKTYLKNHITNQMKGLPHYTKCVENGVSLYSVNIGGRQVEQVVPAVCPIVVG